MNTKTVVKTFFALVIFIVIFIMGFYASTISRLAKSPNTHRIENEISTHNRINGEFIDTSIIENVINHPDFDYCENHYDELLYLTYNDFPRSGLAAVKMAYTFSKVDLVLKREINNLLIESYCQLVEDAQLLNSLSAEEKTFLMKQYDRLLPADWDTEKNKF